MARFGVDRKRAGGARISGRTKLFLEFLESRLTPATSTWTGAVSGFWSNADNWQGNVLPQTGDSLVFPSGALNIANNQNDYSAVTSYASLQITGSGYTIKGDAITVTGTIDADLSSSSSEVDLPLTLTAATPTVTVDTQSTTLILGGAISGSTGLTKSGLGELELKATNGYTGTTAVTEGVLIVNGTQSQSPVTLSSNTTLSGTGTVGAITTTGATLSPGQSGPGLLTASGNVTLDSASIFSVALNGATAGTNYSQLDASGTINLANATLDTTLGFTPTANEQFTIINNTGSSAITGTFNGLAEGATFTVSGQTFKISYVGGTGNDVVLTQLVGTTTTAPTATPTSSVYGQSVSLSATVAPTSGSTTPTGSVQFFVGGTTSLGTGTLNASGMATVSTTAIPVGSTNSITAEYLGSSAFSSSTSTATTYNVALANSSTAVTASPTSPMLGQSVTLTATVAAASPGSGTPTGTVQFYAGATSLGTGTLSSGVATLSTTSLALGANSITAVYGGDGNFNTSTSPTLSVTVQKDATSTTLTASPNPGTIGGTVTLTATVTATIGTTTPTGTVTFEAGGSAIGTGTLNASGVATLATTALPVGNSDITAVYSGDTTNATSTSADVVVAVGTDNQIFINQVYLDVLGRAADSKGLAFWSDLLDKGTSTRVVLNAIVRSKEAVNNTVQTIFQDLLGTSATPRQVKTVLSIPHPSALNITADVLGSRMFWKSQGGGTISGFLSALGTSVLGSSLPSGANSFFTQEIRNGVPTLTIAQQLLGSTIGEQATVNSIYNQFLGRTADSIGLPFYTAMINDGFTPGQVTVDVLASAEYYDLALASLAAAPTTSSASTSN